VNNAPHPSMKMRACTLGSGWTRSHMRLLTSLDWTASGTGVGTDRDTMSASNPHWVHCRWCKDSAHWPFQRLPQVHGNESESILSLQTCTYPLMLITTCLLVACQKVDAATPVPQRAQAFHCCFTSANQMQACRWLMQTDAMAVQMDTACLCHICSTDLSWRCVAGGA
jgi:hypothetical protein